jgi:hypothetical protein
MKGIVQVKIKNQVANVRPRPSMSGWICILMTSSRKRRCWKILFGWWSAKMTQKYEDNQIRHFVKILVIFWAQNLHPWCRLLQASDSARGIWWHLYVPGNCCPRSKKVRRRRRRERWCRKPVAAIAGIAGVVEHRHQQQQHRHRRNLTIYLLLNQYWA